MLLLPALNAMLGLAALASALLAGHGMSAGTRRSWVHLLCFTGITAGSVYVITDLEFPRLGLVRVDSFDQLLVELRGTME